MSDGLTSHDISAGYELVWRLPREETQHRLEFESLDAANRYLDDNVRAIAKEWDLFSNGVLVNNGWYER